MSTVARCFRIISYLKPLIVDKLIYVVDEGWRSDIANRGFENIAPDTIMNQLGHLIECFVEVNTYQFDLCSPA